MKFSQIVPFAGLLGIFLASNPVNAQEASCQLLNPADPSTGMPALMSCNGTIYQVVNGQLVPLQQQNQNQQQNRGSRSSSMPERIAEKAAERVLNRTLGRIIGF